MTNRSPIYGAVEAGGTKFVCAIGDESGKILKEERFPTQDAASTLARMRLFLRNGCEEFGALSGIGVGSFGPVQLDRRSVHYGYITHTPKPGWSGTDIIGGLAREFSCAVGFDTDVNAAALAEHRWGSAQDVQNLVYVTVGTGIGGGALVNGKPIHGLMHPEIAWKGLHRDLPFKRGAVRRLPTSTPRIFNGNWKRTTWVNCVLNWY